jgi:hypothetical protein
MARSIPVVVTMTKAMCSDLAAALTAAGRVDLAGKVGAAVAAAGCSDAVTVSMTRKVALEMHKWALNDIQRGGIALSHASYDSIEDAFRAGYDARLRKSCGC